jgi:small subunit ribosomal protein S6
MVIFPIEEEKFKTGIEGVRGGLSEFGADIEKEEPFGDRELCYLIKKQSRGRYVLFNIRVNPAKIIDIDGRFKLNQNVLKFLFVRVDE